MARKREEKETSHKNKKGLNKNKRSNHKGVTEDAEILKSQLNTLGLTLREVPGDGNCLFRALGDQLEGHMGNHYRHRQDITNYMIENQKDFQPFVEDDVPFEKHVSTLAQLGTYAGNDAIVAFARLHQVTVVIHQPNTPLWQIKDWDSGSKKCEKTSQLHIAYHGGDHYDSVRRIDDGSHSPANIFIQVDEDDAKKNTYQTKSYLYQPDEQEYEVSVGYVDIQEPSEIEQEAMVKSGCEDLLAVRQLLLSNCGNLDAAIEDLLTLTNCKVAEDSQNLEENKKSSQKKRMNTVQPNRKQLEKIKKQERKRANENRKKPVVEDVDQQAPNDFLISKVQCLNI